MATLTESVPRCCCSLDILPDELGGPRNAFPHSMYMVAGTQAASAKRNYLALIKLSDIKQGGHGAKAGAADDSDDDLLSDSDEEVEDPPQMHLRMQASTNHCDSSQRGLCSAPPSPCMQHQALVYTLHARAAEGSSTVSGTGCLDLLSRC